jgi:uncharacterized phage protein (TIGR02216 family)
MEMGLGGLKIPRSEFWRMSLAEFDALVCGHNKANTVPGEEEPEHLTREEIDEMNAMYPDG